jgi:hypothetical protein
VAGAERFKRRLVFFSFQGSLHVILDLILHAQTLREGA